MNYIKLHEKFIDYFKSTLPRDRLLKRNSSDPRLKQDTLYTEVHHVLPRHSDGDNDSDNLVRVLPEEHLFIHQIRYKAYDDRNDMLAVRFCLNGFSGKKYRGEFIPKAIMLGYAWMRSESARFRKVHGWQTEDGRKRISEARKGTMPAVDAITRESVGAVAVDHPNVISGKWVHHSKGRATTKEQREALSIRNTGKGNGNALKITDDEIIELYMKSFIDYGYIITYQVFIKWCAKQDIKVPKSLKTKTRFNGNATKEIYKIMETKTGTVYSSYTKERCANISKGVRKANAKNRNN